MRSPDQRPRLEDGPLRPAAPSGQVHVWRVELEDADGSPPASPRAAARRALRTILARYLDRHPEEVELARGEHGKPELAGPGPQLEFNLSHSGRLALVAVAGEWPVGVDVERLSRKRDFVALAERELGADVVAALRGAAPEERGAIFYAAWARHEARAKCHGGGLGGPPPPEPVAVTDLAVGEGYAAALAVPGTAPPAYRLYRLGQR